MTTVTRCDATRVKGKKKPMGEKGKNRHVTIGLFLRGRGGGADQGMVLKQGIFLGRRHIEQVIIFCGVRSADVALLSIFYFI